MFSKPCVIGLCANVNEGKSNTLYYILDELNKDFHFKVYTYGLKCEYPNTLLIHSVDEMEQIQDSIIIIDEVFSLWDLDNRKSKSLIESTLRLLHHNNNILVVCGLAENFKKFLSAKLNAVIFKRITFADLINGSRVKNIIMSYKGYERGSSMLNLEKGEAIFYDGLRYDKLDIPYMKEYDSKAKNVPIIVEKVCNKSVPKREELPLIKANM